MTEPHGKRADTLPQRGGAERGNHRLFDAYYLGWSHRAAGRPRNPPSRFDPAQVERYLSGHEARRLHEAKLANTGAT